MRRFKKILCVLERGKGDKPTLERAVSLAELNQATLTVVDVLPRITPRPDTSDTGLDYEGLYNAAIFEREQSLESLIDPYRIRLEIEHKAIVGAGFLEVIREVLRAGHDLVIKSTDPPAWLNRIFSSDDMHLLRKCPSPVWLFRSPAPRPFKRIVAAIDVGEHYPPKEIDTRRSLNEGVVEMAASLALMEHAELHIAYAWQSVYELAKGSSLSAGIASEKWAADTEEERKGQHLVLEQAVQGIKMKSDATRELLDYLEPVLHLLDGSPSTEIPALAKRLSVDCVVMGTVARTGIRGLIIGNTAETILSQIACSVLAIKPPGFVTPVGLDD